MSKPRKRTAAPCPSRAKASHSRQRPGAAPPPTSSEASVRRGSEREPVTADEFRGMALGFPGAIEGAHMDHPDFRVAGKIFASLGPRGDWGMVKLTPEQQSIFVRQDPDTFVPFGGAWGRRGCTKVLLASASPGPVRQALHEAWRNLAAQRRRGELEER